MKNIQRSSVWIFLLLLVAVFFFGRRDKLEVSDSTDGENLQQNLPAKSLDSRDQGVRGLGFMEVDSPKALPSEPDSRAELPTVFESVAFDDAELESFFERRYEPREVTMAASGLRIHKSVFQKDTVEELPKSLSIPLPQGGVKFFNQKGVDFKSKGNFVWVGDSPGGVLETLYLSVYNEAVVGFIETENGTYEIKQFSKEKNIIRKIDDNQYPQDCHDDVPSVDLALALGDSSLAEVLGDIPFTGILEDSTVLEREFNEQLLTVESSEEVAGVEVGDVVIDLTVGYSHLIKRTEGGLDPSLAWINLLVSYTNEVHKNSNTGVFINLKATVGLGTHVSVSLRDELYKLLAVAGGMDLIEKLVWWWKGNSVDDESLAPYRLLVETREETQSDLAILLAEEFAGRRICGIAWGLKRWESSKSFKNKAFSVVAANCGPSVFVHEIGHNLGSGHNREDAFSPMGLRYAFGFRSEEKRFRTVMSYPCANAQCGRLIPYFSTPEKSVLGTILGDVLTDNVRSIRKRAPVVSNIYF